MKTCHESQICHLLVVHPWAPHWPFLSTKGTTQLSSQVPPAHSTAAVVVLQLSLFLLSSKHCSCHPLAPHKAHRVKDKIMRGSLSPLTLLGWHWHTSAGCHPNPASLNRPSSHVCRVSSLTCFNVIFTSIFCPPIKIILPVSISLLAPAYFSDSLYHYLKYSMFYSLISLSLSPIRL